MAIQTKVNPELANTGRFFLGKTLDMYTLDFAVNATNFGSTEMGPNECVQIALRTISTMCTIVGHSALRADSGANAGQLIDIYVEGDFGTDTYDGTNSESFAAHLEDLIQGLGATVGANSIDLTSATVTRGTGFPLLANHV
jgi:hypothetical protein